MTILLMKRIGDQSIPHLKRIALSCGNRTHVGHSYIFRHEACR